MRTRRFCVLAVLCFGLTLVPYVLASDATFPTNFTQLATLKASDIDGGASWFGFTVSISGNTVVVGAPFANNNAGAAYVFVKPASGWADMTQTAELSPSDGTAGIEFGLSVAISGNTIVVGSFSHNTAYVYSKPKSGWKNMTETAKLSAATNTNGVADGFGAKVAISGTTIAVAAYQASSDRGRVDLFLKPKIGWRSAHPAGHLFAPDPKIDGFFGAGLAMNASTIVVGAPGGFIANEGEAYVYQKPAAGWQGSHRTAAILTPSDASLSNFFGEVAISGNTVVVGAEAGNNNIGATYVYVEPASGWTNMTESAELTPSDGFSNDWFGSSVAMMGQTVIASAPDNANPGALYTFDEPSGGWVNATQTSELTVSGSADLGSSIAIAGNIMVVGARNSGTAYIFTK